MKTTKRVPLSVSPSDLRFDWVADNLLDVLDIEIQGPCDIRLYGSVQQKLVGETDKGAREVGLDAD